MSKSDRPEPDRESGEARARELVGVRAAGIVILALALLFAFLRYGPDTSEPREDAARPISVQEAGTGRGSTENRPMSPHAAADRLFNQAMTAAETGDSVAAARLVPMALTAYRGLDSLDLDARYHVALLNLAAGEPERARAQADSILTHVSDHLLGLQVAAAAERRLARPDRAQEIDRRLLEGYAPEVVESRPEYRMHEALITRAVQEARDRLPSRTP